MLRRCSIALLFLVIVLLPSPARANPSERIPIAVSYFANTGNDKSLDVLKKALADMLTTDLSVADDLVVVEREQLDLVLDEIRLQKNPFFDKAGAIRLGNGLGADFIVTGSFVQIEKTLRIDVKVLDVADGSIVFAVQKTGNDGAVFKLQAELAKSLLAELGAKLTRIQAKRVGRGGPSHIRSLKTYGKALEAADAGKRSESETLLREALASDPTFTRVQSRLESLENKVEALAASGGLILKPVTAGEFLHNYRLHMQRSARELARTSLESAIRLAPNKLDGWLALGSEGASARMPKKVALTSMMRALVRSYLSENQEALRARLKGKSAAPAALLLFDLAMRDLPSTNLSPYLHAQAAMQHLTSNTLAALVSDPEQYLETIRQAKRRYFEGKDDGESGTVVFREGSAVMQMGVWNQWVGIDESPKGDVTVRLTRANHPTWAAKPPLPPYPEKRRPASKSELASWPHIFKPLDKARRTKNGYVWLVRHPVHGGTKLVEDTATKLGERLSVPGKFFTCKDSKHSLTGKRCSTALELTASFLLPGRYEAEISYTGHDGAVHDSRTLVWFRDTELHESDPSELRGQRKMYHPIASLDGKAGALVRKNAIASLVGKRRFPVAGVVHANTYWRGHSDPTPNDGFQRLHSLYLDIDYALLGGTAPESDKQKAAYRDLVLRKGYELQGSRQGNQYVPLPALSNKAHTVCLVAKLTNKAISPEANCRTITP